MTHYTTATAGIANAYSRFDAIGADRLLRPVRRLAMASVILGSFGLSSLAQAQVVSPDAGLQAKLGPIFVSISYRPSDAGYRVVVTASTREPDSVVRFVSTLAPGQYTIVSVPRGVGQSALEMRLSRIGDRIELERPTS
jgi:hypothetical protein